MYYIFVYGYDSPAYFTKIKNKYNPEFNFSTNFLRKKTFKIKKPLTYKGSEVVICGPAWARTMDPLIMSQVL